jgi:hypothetical protein
MRSAQWPQQHVWPVGQTLPHEPQLLSSLFLFTQPIGQQWGVGAPHRSSHSPHTQAAEHVRRPGQTVPSGWQASSRAPGSVHVQAGFEHSLQAVQSAPQVSTPSPHSTVQGRVEPAAQPNPLSAPPMQSSSRPLQASPGGAQALQAQSLPQVLVPVEAHAVVQASERPGLVQVQAGSSHAVQVQSGWQVCVPAQDP